MKIIFMILGIFITNNALAVIGCESTKDKSPVVFYVNGVLSNLGSSQKSINALNAAITSNKFGEYRHAINTTHGISKDLKEAAKQRNEEPSVIHRWLVNTSLAPNWYQRNFANRMQALNQVSYSNNADLQLMTNQFITALRSGRKVILVSHSQGNFFANRAYHYIFREHPSLRESIGIVAVASPSSFVGGGGTHFRNLYDSVIAIVDTFL